MISEILRKRIAENSTPQLETAGIGAIVAAWAWLAMYIIAGLYSLTFDHRIQATDVSALLEEMTSAKAQHPN